MKTQDFIQLLKQHSVNSLPEKWEQDVENFPPSAVKWLTECCHNIAFAQHHRPHGTLKGRTPIEAYTEPTLTPPLWGGKEGFDFTPQILLSKATRVLYNRQNACGACSK